MKFNVIRKWAKENNYEVTESTYNNSKIHIIIDEKNSFTVDYRDSSIYRSVRGRGRMKGNSKGLYLAFNNGYSFNETTQKNAIVSMENYLQGFK